MKQAMKEMLQDFIERDFSAYEMQQVIGVIADVEQDYTMIVLHRKRDSIEMVLKYKSELQDDMLELRDQLWEKGLSYNAKDLVDVENVDL